MDHLLINKMLSSVLNYAQADRAGVAYIVIHYTGNKGDTAAANAAYFSRENAGASAHYFVDETSVWQSVSDRDVAWHCGCKTGYFHPECRNANSIGIEICMLDKAGKIRQRSIDNAAKLTRELMKKYGVSISHVVRHYDVTHKLCPEPMVKDVELWSKFKTAVLAADHTEEDEGMIIYKTRKDIPDWARPTVDKLIAKGFISSKDDELDLEHNMLRVLVINDRAGLYK